MTDGFPDVLLEAVGLGVTLALVLIGFAVAVAILYMAGVPL